MVGDKYGDEVDMESTSFILQDADSYRGELVGMAVIVIRGWQRTLHKYTLSGPPILISDNEDFSDITQLLHSDDHEDYIYTRSEGFTINICDRKVT